MSEVLPILGIASSSGGPTATVEQNNEKLTILPNLVGNTVSDDVKTALSKADKNWSSTKVTNKGNAAGSANHEEYTITIDSDFQVTGEWTK